MLAADVYGSTWPNRIPTQQHTLWRGNLSTKATEINRALSQYDAIFALGGKSLITILYTEGQAVPDQCKVFQLSADAGDLGRTYSSELSVVGDIKSSLKVLLPELEKATANHRRDYQRRFEKAVYEFKLSKESLLGQVQEQQSATVITPLVAAFEAARAIGPDVAIVDEAIATSGSLRKSLNSHRADQYAFYAAVAWDGECPRLSAIHSVWEKRLWCALWETARRCTPLRLSGRPHMKNCQSPLLS